MSRTYDALKRAEAAQAGRAEAAQAGRAEAAQPGRVEAAQPSHVEAAQAVRVGAPVKPAEGNRREAPNGRAAPWPLTKLRDVNRVEYQRIGVWLASPAPTGERVKTVMIAGCRPGSGSTTTASMLGLSLAESTQRRILLVEANLHTPALSKLFAVAQAEGLSDALGEKLPIPQGIQATHHPGLFVLPGGRQSRHSHEVLDADAIDRCLPELRQAFDLVIFDAPPVIKYPDACALVSRVDGALLVVEADRTSMEDAQRAKRDLEQAGGRLLGVVINRQKNYIPRPLRKFFASHV